MRNAIRQEKSRRSFFEFTKYTKPDFIEGWFNQLVADALQQFYLDVEAGLQPRLMIFAPPRSGKSELFSRRFPAWALGRNPDLQIIAASYAADLSSRMNRDVQKIIDDQLYQNVFPSTSLNSKNIVTVANNPLRNSDIFEIVGHAGTYRSAGVGGGITGMGADIAIIDDPVKDAKEANSETIRSAVWDWYTTTLYTRLSPNSGVLLGMTRWHDDDLAGRLLKAAESGEGEQWKIIRFPAIAEFDEEFRKEGEPLHPERYSLERLHGIKKAIGSHSWNALYQQRPTTKGGGIIKGEWFQRYTVLPRLKRVIITVDTAMKVKQHNDYSVFMVVGLGIDGGIYILDVIRGKWEAPDLERKAKDIWSKYSEFSPQAMYIEDKASGTGLIQKIRSEKNIPVRPVQVEADKYTRVLGAQGYVESKYVYLPNDAPWVSDFINECESFTANDSHKHDDQVDTLTMAIQELKTGKVNILDIL